MKQERQPRFIEENRKLRQAILRYGDNAKLARESGVTRGTIERIAIARTKFPWFQTVHALRLVLDRQFILLPQIPVTKTQPVRSRNERKRVKNKPDRKVIRQSARRSYKLV